MITRTKNTGRVKIKSIFSLFIKVKKD